MAGFGRVLRMEFVPQPQAIGLAQLRIVTGLVLFLRHGWEKRPSHWAQFMAHFPDPLHIGSHPSFLIAFVSDFICAWLLVLGLGTRWAALFCLGNIFVAWAFVHHFAFFGEGPQAGHGELIVLYLTALAAMFLCGPGAASLDGLIGRK